MRLYLLILLMATVYAGELEVEGNLSVTEGVTATSFVGDGSGLTNLPSLGDMKPERIYVHVIDTSEDYNLTVPVDKVWFVTTNRAVEILINNSPISSTGGAGFWFLPSYNIQVYNPENYVLSILEYSISGSGTDQGMDYIEP